MVLEAASGAAAFKPGKQLLNQEGIAKEKEEGSSLDGQVLSCDFGNYSRNLNLELRFKSLFFQPYL